MASSVFLIVLSIAGENHLPTVWRVCFGVGIALPLIVLVFRLRMLSSKLYRKGAIKSEYDLSCFPTVNKMRRLRKGTISTSFQTLLEVADRYMWCMVWFDCRA